MKCRYCAILAILPFMTLLIAKNKAQSAKLVIQMRNSAEDEARSAELVTQMLINEATRLFSGLADLDYKPGYNNHTYFQYLSNNKNDISLLGAYHPEEIFDKYIIQVAGKGFTVVNHPSEIYGIPDAHECIDGNLPFRLLLDIDARQKPDPINSGLPFLDTNKISRKDLLSRILIACADI
ncbi:6670_t:CDS:2 [Gigaspora margarita]|uniref:6670_t:CDS:1 n=1 Tax=Gigaspora margarita TaxID=4874 RepID=A0ABN7VXC0_GIGMA|nr:6670_t:CDS:2 [Gigaspora margarita]